ncbi:hypothetical protein V6N13_069908 [Hibiscus sabdariffa]|uniref:Myb-like domain-containing protein n=1 Tax=Hibiscus sabdariffa TaxID=183260 RepID=A0ABR2BJI6_9ROSI
MGVVSCKHDSKPVLIFVAACEGSTATTGAGGGAASYPTTAGGGAGAASYPTTAGAASYPTTVGGEQEQPVIPPLPVPPVIPPLPEGEQEQPVIPPLPEEEAPVPRQRQRWTLEADVALVAAVTFHGKRWGEVRNSSEHLRNRSISSLESRFYKLNRGL